MKSYDCGQPLYHARMRKRSWLARWMSMPPKHDTDLLWTVNRIVEKNVCPVCNVDSEHMQLLFMVAFAVDQSLIRQNHPLNSFGIN